MRYSSPLTYRKRIPVYVHRTSAATQALRAPMCSVQEQAMEGYKVTSGEVEDWQAEEVRA